MLSIAETSARAAATAARPLPVRRPDLIIRPLGNDGDHVVKDPVSGEYFSVGAQEHFLLVGLDGRQSAEALRAAFARQWDEPLSADDLDEFVALARVQGWLIPAQSPLIAGDTAVQEPPLKAAPKRPRQSILYWRKRAFDPDRLFNRIEPTIRFIWTPAFVVVSVAFVALAAAVAWTNRREFVTHFADPNAARWETWLIVWLTLVAATTLHEFSHGLTCKHFGGEVHEVGFLMLFFIPCFYCNVSDAWLFRERSRRLWVTLAGGYCDLLVWAAAVFVWRATTRDSMANYVAWVVVTVASARNVFNFNPLLKLDGYYLLSDAMGIPNLRLRALVRFMAVLRRALWGAPRPPRREPHARFLTLFGAASWTFSAVFLCLMLLAYVRVFGHRWGVLGLVAVFLFAAATSPQLVQGLSSGEITRMIKTRRTRTALWAVGLPLVLLAGLAIPCDDRATGPCDTRAVQRAEVRAQASGFLRELHVDTGTPVTGDAEIARLEVPDLASRTEQKRNEVREAEARVELASAGARVRAADGLSEMKITGAERAMAAAQLLRLREELAYLERLRERQSVRSPVPGVVVTPHVRERVGEFFKEGDLVCVVENCAEVEVEVRLPEEEVQRVRAGQPVDVKLRTLPFDTLRGTVRAVAPVASAGKDGAASTVTVYCRLQNATPDVRPAMTGDARIVCGRQPAGLVIARRVLRYVRTDLWW
jgi:RND family efflux transporter MFP subunit